MLKRAWNLLRWFFEQPRSQPRQPVARGLGRTLTDLDFLKLKASVAERRYDTARKLLRRVGGDPSPEGDATDAAARLCEEVADDLREWDREGSIWLYEQAICYFQEFAAWASTGREGSARMGSVSRLETKLRHIRAIDAK
jgi:hypothetical protein